MTQSKTIIFNVLYALVFLAGMFGFGNFHPSQSVLEWLALVGSAINLYLRSRPLPQDQEHLR